MTDGERIVRRRISRTEARSAERRLHDRPRLHQIRNRAVLHQFHIDRRTRRIHTEGEFIRTDIASAYDICRRADILESAACTSRDDSLLHVQPAVYDLVLQRIVHSPVKTNLSLLLHIMKHILKVRVDLVDRIYIRRMERHRDHRPDLT